MRTSLKPEMYLAIVRVALMAALTSTNLSAAPATLDVEPTHWFTQFQHDLRAAWVRPDVSMHGNVKFVSQNDVWQPGRHFKDGKSWLALACTSQGCALEPATLSVKNEMKKDLSDDKATAGQHLQFSLVVPSKAKTIAWFDTSVAPTWLRPGSVTAYFSGIGHPKETGKGTLEALIGLPSGETATLVPLLLKDTSQDESDPFWFLQLRAQNKRQLLLGMLDMCSGSVNSEDYLLWAGDLDGDGKPDYLISFVDTDGPVHLYLSSAATPKQLVGLAGVYNIPPDEVACEGARAKN